MQPSSSSAGPDKFDRQKLAEIARTIRTDGVLDERSRALVVFNISEDVVFGTGRFASLVTWEAGAAFPGVRVTTWTGEPVPSTITDFQIEPDPKGRPGKVRLAFNLNVYVETLIGRTWRTYIASFDDEGASTKSGVLSEPDLAIVVLEADSQAGDLGPVGNF